MLIVMPRSALIRLRMSAPMSTTARARSEMSVTFDEFDNKLTFFNDFNRRNKHARLIGINANSARRRRRSTGNIEFKTRDGVLLVES